MNYYICIHGHFYQPPRENPWLEAVEQQDSAYPYHDWNERITEECYAANAAARILNEKKQITQIGNNYEKISFNFGATLLSWLEEKAPDVYQGILQADKDSVQRLEGHGNAIAQSYNHTILPLCNRQDKITQILWGIRDFIHRFQRQPQGLWLPETAVDLESLAILAEHGIKFTILAQHQAKRIRKIGNSAWQDVAGGQIDPTMPYLLQLPEGRSMAIFFYDGAVSQAVAFSSLLNKGENLAEGIAKIFSDKRNRAQLAHIATDGETYGHHHRHGDMALAYALDYIERKNIAQLTNYSQFLQKYPPSMDVEILENTSWSCAHGIERWKSACGCRVGGERGWNQNWRAPLRQTLDWLRDELIKIYQDQAKPLFQDPWAARNEYIDVILNRHSESVLANFFEKIAAHPLNDIERQSALILLEMQRYAMLMYTSCGWFFDEVSGIETVQIISYAARAIQLAEKLVGKDCLEKPFTDRLSQIKSNLKRFGDARNLYETLVKPCMLDWYRIGAHYATSSLFINYEQKANIYCYEVKWQEAHHSTTGNLHLIRGYGQFKSTITTESTELAFAAIHFGDQNINCGICEFNQIDYPQASQSIDEAFEGGDIVRVNNLFAQYFGKSTYSISSLFRDEQRRVLDKIFEETLKEVESAYTQLYQHHAALIRFIENLNIPLPEPFKATAEHVINIKLRMALSKQLIKTAQIFKLLKDAEMAKIKLDKVILSFTLKHNLEQMMQKLTADPSSLPQLEHISSAMVIAEKLAFSINLFHIQNMFYQLFKEVYPKFKETAAAGDSAAKSWIDRFSFLANQLSVYVP